MSILGVLSNRPNNLQLLGPPAASESFIGLTALIPPYVLASGNNIFSLVNDADGLGPGQAGQVLNIATNTVAAVSAIRRTFTPADIVCTYLQVDFKIVSAALNDDGAQFNLLNAAGTVFSFYITPIRETALDALRRCQFGVNNGAFTPMSPAQLTTGLWYRARFQQNAGAGNSFVELRVRDTEALVQRTAIAAAIGPLVFNRVQWSQDANVNTNPVRYSNLVIY